MSRNQNATRPRPSLLAAVALLLSIPGMGQIRGPVSGVVFHRASRSLRPILGVPGSAYLGAPLVQEIESAAVAPDGNCAFVTRQSKGVLICGLAEGRPAEVSIPDLIADADSAAWNRKGDTAVIYSAGRMQWIRLRETGQPTETTVDLGPLGGKPSTLAVSDDGRQVAVGVEGGLYRVSEDGSLALGAPIGHPAGAVFGPGNTIYVLDQTAQEIRVVDAGNGVTAIPLADANDLKPVGLAVSDDGRKVWVALAGQPMMRAYDTLTRQLESEETLDAAPSAVQRIGSALYLLNSAESDGVPLLVLRTGETPATLFIPCEACQ